MSKIKHESAIQPNYFITENQAVVALFFQRDKNNNIHRDNVILFTEETQPDTRSILITKYILTQKENQTKIKKKTYRYRASPLRS